MGTSGNRSPLAEGRPDFKTLRILSRFKSTDLFFGWVKTGWEYDKSDIKNVILKILLNVSHKSAVRMAPKKHPIIAGRTARLKMICWVTTFIQRRRKRYLSQLLPSSWTSHWAHRTELYQMGGWRGVCLLGLNGLSSGQITEARADNNKSEQKYLFDHYFCPLVDDECYSLPSQVTSSDSNQTDVGIF